MFARMAKGAWLAGVATVLAAGCSALNPLAFRTGDARPLLPEAKAIRNTVPMPPPVPRELDKTVLPAYIVEPGDVLLVQPVKLDSPARMPPDQTVLPDGKIDLGEYGRVLVAGKSVEAVEAAVQAVVQAKTPDAGMINVRLVGRNSKVYYVLGQVNAPGSFPLQGRETVLDGIVAAGGLNTRASRGNIILSRPTVPDGCRVVLPVCYPQIVQLGDTTTNYQLQPGDRIYVPAADCWESIFGQDRDEKQGCTPCNRPQRGCPWNCNGPAAAPATPAALPAGVLPEPVAH
ncbi:MAG TPA: SLBB domain-containing protein [Gemmataceae bacterium]|jgi:protein involved in polysaccharide export with SLBB domain